MLLLNNTKTFFQEIAVIEPVLKIIKLITGIFSLIIGGVIFFFGLEPLTVINSSLLVVLFSLFGLACLKDALSK